MKMPANILIVDDDPGAIHALHHALQGMGKISYATGGIDALGLLAEQPADLILLDANMPEIDGFEVCATLQREYPGIPVMFVTADNETSQEIKALEAGACDFVGKPIHRLVVRARVGVHLKLKAQSDLLRDLIGRDPLTGLANRRALDEWLSREWRRSSRTKLHLGLLMIDIDHFKLFNDVLGHRQGDECLSQVAKVLSDNVNRAGDLVGRYGGEEFVVLATGCTAADIAALGAKLNAAVSALAIPHPRSSAAPVVTVSIGGAVALPAMERRPLGMVTGPADEGSGLELAKDLIDRADQALYVAKDTGRNRVCMDGVA